jgi:signal transduction histidine kinase/putative methionine-R-sulfoxide reductase with GAF domain
MPSEVSMSGAGHDREPTVEDLKRDLAAARQREAATAEILRVISETRTDVQPVFDTIVKSAVRLCDGLFSGVYRFDGELLHHVAHYNYAPEALAEVQRKFPTRPARDFGTGRAVIERSTIHIPDVEVDREYRNHPLSRAVGMRSGLFVPMLRDGAPLGAIVVARAEPGPFSDKEIALLQTFADQAVIAIENARLFEAEQASKRELQRSLDYQTATSEVLNVISRSPSQLQPVVDAIVQTAKRLCSAERATMWRWREGRFDLLAHTIIDPALANYLKDNPIPPDRTSLATRAVLEGQTMHVPDLQTEPELGRKDQVVVGRIRTLLAVPLLRKGEPIGVLSLSRSEVKPFSDSEIELVETFADQAVIAIENTRLFEAEQERTRELTERTRELTETLEYQTATSDVLSVISRSPSDLQPVLQAIVETAVRLCQADFADFRLLRDGLYLIAATTTQETIDVKKLRADAIAPGRDSVVGRAALERHTVHVPDAQADPEYTYRMVGQLGPVRSLLGVPLVRDDVAVGVIVLFNRTVRPFTPKQIGLVTTFADQALIAIENTRLFEEVQARTRELTESLEQQTATADVLKVISRSALDVQKVLDALVESAARLCDAYDAVIFQVFGDSLRLVAHHGQIPMAGPVGQHMTPLVRGRIVGRAVIDRRTIHVADILAEGDEYPDVRKRALQQGFRTVLGVPLVHAGAAIGVIFIRRTEVRPFTERQIELVNTFADQAVIAIENTRLFEEVQARTRDLAKTVEDLEIASQHKNQFVANMSHELRTPLAAILGYAELIQEGFYEPQGPKSLDALTRIRSNGKHLLGLINTVLDIAKIESGQFTLNMSEYAIESVVETVRAATESLAQNKKLTLTTSIDKLLPIGLGDEQRLTQVLLNLVGNAIKFTDAGEVHVTAKAVDGHFNISVTDTGPGIPKEHQARIFEQFHQVDSSNTKAKGGTGLGLAIAKQIVEMHGGRIWVESTFGKGSTFQMELPTRAEFQKLAL